MILAKRPRSDGARLLSLWDPARPLSLKSDGQPARTQLPCSLAALPWLCWYVPFGSTDDSFHLPSCLSTETPARTCKECQSATNQMGEGGARHHPRDWSGRRRLPRWPLCVAGCEWGGLYSSGTATSKPAVRFGRALDWVRRVCLHVSVASRTHSRTWRSSMLSWTLARGPVREVAAKSGH